DDERDRHDDRELRLGALEILELAAPFEAVTGWDPDLLRQCALRVGDIAADVAVVHVDIDVIHELGVLGADHRRPLGDPYRGDLTEWHRGSTRGLDQHLRGDRLWIVP